jgi:polyhydroxyalkanoate synthase subunit PhaC
VNEMNGSPGQDIQASVLELTDLTTRLVRVMSACTERQWREMSGQDFALVDRSGLGMAFGQFALQWMSNPIQWWADFSKLAEQHVQLAAEFATDREDQAGKQRLQGDKRFAGPAWSENSATRYLAAAHRVNEDWAVAVANQVEGLDPQSKAKVSFFTRQFMSAIAPSNSALINPQVVKRSTDENGANLMRGLRHLVEDLERRSRPSSRWAATWRRRPAR